ncbi:uncharacterized protein LOC5502610 isoform X2 [Nematostella vectensis]|uniref:uncharacterized protein LOC5502610 isoform X2 n=1 Tax=Nematostella vectensis TaxID=45351 RepID=UPI0020771A65|nr:uncharacterized protein LOC5502610 isoform X2 [Nematostella vectensis]
MKLIVLLFLVFIATAVDSAANEEELQKQCLDAHNEFRTRHGAGKLAWSGELASEAQKWANHLASIDQMERDPLTNGGENIFYMYGGNPREACERAVRNWYQEVKNYDFKNPHSDPSTSHFSQLVWKGTKKLGVGEAQSKSGNFFLVARYHPKGNMEVRLSVDPDKDKQNVTQSTSDNKTEGTSRENTTRGDANENSEPTLANVVFPGAPIVTNTSAAVEGNVATGTTADAATTNLATGNSSPTALVTSSKTETPTVSSSETKTTRPTKIRDTASEALQPISEDQPEVQPSLAKIKLHVEVQKMADEKLMTEKPPKEGKDFRVELRFTGIKFEHSMGFPYSDSFETVRRNITPVIMQVYEDYQPFQEVQLMAISNGSIIPALGLIFSKKGEGHLDLLTAAISTGNLGGFAVSPGYVSAAALADNYLKLTLPPQPHTAPVCPQPCSAPTLCYHTGCHVDCCAFHPTHPHHPTTTLAPPPPACPATCDQQCYPQCAPACCDTATPTITLPPAFLYPSVPVVPPAQPPPMPDMGYSCPSDCHFSCYPQCTPECCSTTPPTAQCPSSCAWTCAPDCTSECCARHKVSAALSRPLTSKLAHPKLLPGRFPRLQSLARQSHLRPYIGHHNLGYALGKNAGHSAFVNHNTFLPRYGFSRTLKKNPPKHVTIRHKVKGLTGSAISRMRDLKEPLGVELAYRYGNKLLVPVPVNYEEMLRPKFVTVPLFKRTGVRKIPENTPRRRIPSNIPRGDTFTRPQFMRRNNMPQAYRAGFLGFYRPDYSRLTMVQPRHKRKQE